MNFTFQGLQASATVVEKLNRSVQRMQEHAKITAEQLEDELKEYHKNRTKDKSNYTLIAAHYEKFCAAMDDDLNISRGFAALFDGLKEMHAAVDQASSAERAQDLARQSLIFLYDIDSVLGLMDFDPDQDNSVKGFTAEKIKEIEDLIDQRNAARKARDFAEADRIRDLLLEESIVLKDSPDGTHWEVE